MLLFPAFLMQLYLYSITHPHPSTHVCFYDFLRCGRSLPMLQQMGVAGRGSGSPHQPWRCPSSRGHPSTTYVPAQCRHTVRSTAESAHACPTFPPRGESSGFGPPTCWSAACPRWEPLSCSWLLHWSYCRLPSSPKCGFLYSGTLNILEVLL